MIDQTWVQFHSPLSPLRWHSRARRNSSIQSAKWLRQMSSSCIVFMHHWTIARWFIYFSLSVERQKARGYREWRIGKRTDLQWLLQHFSTFRLRPFSVYKMQIERHASSERKIINLTFVSRTWIMKEKKKSSNEISCFHKLKHFSLNLRRRRGAEKNNQKGN